MHTIRVITRLAWNARRTDRASASISYEHCRSSHNNPHCAPRHGIYYLCIMRGTDVRISEKNHARKKREKQIFFCKVRHFVNFLKFTKSLRQCLGNLITNNEVFSFQKTDAYCILHTVWVCHFEKVSFSL